MRSLTTEEIADIPYWDIGSISKCSALTKQDVYNAIKNAAVGHGTKKEVKRVLLEIDKYTDKIYNSIMDNSYLEKMQYRKITRKNNNGKIRHIDSPSLYTRILQHLAIILIGNRYKARDNYNALNCKEGCGITANKKKHSIVAKLKHLYYDRRDIHYIVVIDQRKCYEHINIKHIRKALKILTKDTWLIDFIINVTFTNNVFPIGTPTSPLLQHILCLSFDEWCKRISPFSIRYADNCLFAAYTREDANQILWRVKNFWWYELGIRAKRGESKVLPIDVPLDFCGYIFHRVNNKGICEHNKGYTTIRKYTIRRAKICNSNESYASYFGILKYADTYNILIDIEKQMKLRDLTAKIRIDRNMDAPNIKPADLIGKVFNIYNYETRRDSKNAVNWIKFLIGVKEFDEEGIATGKELAFELHGGYMFLIEFILKCEHTYGKKNLLPLEDMEIEQSCGYIFKGSTNQMNYIN